MNSMGKGQIWINGESIGCYWPAYKAHGACSRCNYAGEYREKKCLSYCGDPSQRWYHVPQSWLNPTRNLLVVFEEWGGNPDWITLVRRTAENTCADISELQPTLTNWQRQAFGKVDQPLRPKAHLWCASGQKISSIKFSGYGTPQGACGSYQEGGCHAHKSHDALERNCIGWHSCSVAVAPEIFGGDPCPSIMKKLSVEAVCS